MNYQKIAGEIWKNYNSEEWNTHDFSIKKALYALAHLNSPMNMPQFELDQKSRIKIIPSET